jgi:hypothetical protein
LTLCGRAAGLAIGHCSGGTGAAVPAKIWKPKPTTAAAVPAQGKIDLSIRRVYEVDGFDVSKKTVAQLRRGRKVICYIDVGSWEN